MPPDARESEDSFGQNGHPAEKPVEMAFAVHAQLHAFGNPKERCVAIIRVIPATEDKPAEEEELYRFSADEADAFGVHCIRAAFATRAGMAHLARLEEAAQQLKGMQEAARIDKSRPH